MLKSNGLGDLYQYAIQRLAGMSGLHTEMVQWSDTGLV